MSYNSNLQNIVRDMCIDDGGGAFTNNKPMTYFNRQLLEKFNPDINGFSLCFFLPPPFLGASVESDVFRKLSVFAAVDFTPPVREVKTQTFDHRSAGIPYAVELEPSEQFTVSYLDNTDMETFKFHSAWFDYIHDLTLGYVSAPSIYLDNTDMETFKFHSAWFDYIHDLTLGYVSAPSIYLDPGSGSYGGLDYAGAIFVVKYSMSMQEIVYVGKVTGAYPQSLPNKEIIGQRITNEIVIIPFTYFAGWYEETTNPSHPIWSELESNIISYYG